MILRIKYTNSMRCQSQQTPANHLKNAILHHIKKQTQPHSTNSPVPSHKHPQTKPLPSITKVDLQILQLIECYASKENPGYFRFDGWRCFNEHLFPHVNKIISLDLWKVMRIISMGQVCIATGLVYDLTCHFLSRNSDKSFSVRQIINNFLKMNGSELTVSHFKELNEYTGLDKIEVVYCGLKEKQIVKEAVKERNAMSDVLERMNRAHSKHKASMTQLRKASWAKEAQNCKFRPQIHTYESNQVHRKVARSCHHQSSQPASENVHPLFQASPLDRSMFEKQITSVPGVRQHIQRHTNSQAQRRRVQRIVDKGRKL